MRKSFIWASLAMVLGIFTSFNALSADGVIKFRGVIIDSTCTVDTGKNDFNFGHILTSILNGSTGKSSDLKEFTISFKDCPHAVLKNFNIKFDAGTTKTDSSDNTTYFATTHKNIAIAIYQSNGTSIINPGTSVNNIAISGVNTEYKIKAKLVSTGTPVAAGKFESLVNITTSYP
ncbi:hypothetical protein GEA64_12810 [Photorhabdus khanii]|uniref:Spore coat protein U/FanG domain-containing protein n=1 Tax=Photorhabdus khanii TaxID=1004150 RepID=A0A7C9GJS8_9GAMM|nr:fimbrial protein [Photorhabdus khanii]MQL48793.1 hypothetical protein [Photorhabdus khanii]